MIFKTDNTAANVDRAPLARAGAWSALVWERLWPLLVPVFLLVILFSGVSWLGMWEVFPVWLHIAILSLFGAAAAVALWPLRRFTPPSAKEISRRIEVETGLADRPIGAQSDEMALGLEDDFSRALWSEHRSRMRDRLKDLTSGTAMADGGKFDPYGARLLLPILAFVAFMISFGADGGKISDAFRLGGDPVKLLARLDMWVDAPTYTSKPPVYLSREGKHQTGHSLLIPQYSKLAGRFVGDGKISLKFDNGKNEIEISPSENDEKSASDSNTRNYQFDLKENGTVTIYSRNTKIAEWSLKIVPDEAPQIGFVEEPGASLSGALQLAYKISDDYGVVSARGLVEAITDNQPEPREFDRDFPARFVPPRDARPLIEPLEMKLPLPRRRAKSGQAKVSRDNTKHPLAGTPVLLTLVALDDVDQTGKSKTRTITLPGRIFSNPLAKALIEQRRILALDANQQSKVIAMLDAITIAPEQFIDDYTALLAIKIAYRRLVLANSDEDLRDVMDLMWDVALGVEFGKMSNAERRLREAQERLSEALENGASDEEIDQLMKELRQAMNELMQALTEQARNNPQSQNQMLQDETARILRQKDLQKMLDRIEELAKSGSKDAARELLAEMQRMMDNLRAGRHMQQRQVEGNQTNKALDNLSKLMQKQQRLMDETFKMEQQRPPSSRKNERNDNGQESQGNQQQDGQQENGDENQQMSAQEYADAVDQLRRQQRALEEQLSSLNKQLQDLGLAPTEEFDEAGREMGEAGEQLGKGEAGEAVGNQGQALDALRRGAQSMMQQMAGDRQQGGEQQGTGTSRNSRMSRDPLGRNGTGSQTDTGGNTPGEIDTQRARKILEAIRKRLSKPATRAIEKDYLERLLKNR